MVRNGIPAGRWVAGAECPGGLCQVASTHILRLAQEGSAATTITRDCSGSLTRGSSRRTSPFSTTPTTATWVKGVTANSGRKLRVIGNQPGRGVKPPMRHHLREHRCHGRLRRPMLHQRDAPYPRALSGPWAAAFLARLGV